LGGGHDARERRELLRWRREATKMSVVTLVTTNLLETSPVL
jgi:hypothetical protein